MFEWLGMFNRRKNHCSKCQRYCDRNGYCQLCQKYSLGVMLSHDEGEIREMLEKRRKEDSGLYTKTGTPRVFDREHHRNQVHLVKCQLTSSYLREKSISREELVKDFGLRVVEEAEQEIAMEKQFRDCFKPIPKQYYGSGDYYGKEDQIQLTQEEILVGLKHYKAFDKWIRSVAYAYYHDVLGLDQYDDDVDLAIISVNESEVEVSYTSYDWYDDDEQTPRKKGSFSFSTHHLWMDWQTDFKARKDKREAEKKKLEEERQAKWKAENRERMERDKEYRYQQAKKLVAEHEKQNRE